MRLKYRINWLSKAPIVKELITRGTSAIGKSRGKIVVRHRARGLYANVHLLNRFWLIWNIPGIIVGFERNKFVRSYLALVSFPFGILTYVRAVAGQSIGDKVLSGWDIPPTTGNGLPLHSIPLNIKICCIESYPGSGPKYMMAPGNWGRIAAKTNFYARVVFRGGQSKNFNLFCMAIIGRVSNVKWRLRKVRNAGHTRLLGRRPRVRGVAKNPVDHPHGGGKGKKSKNAVPESPWGRLGARKKKTRKCIGEKNLNV